MKIGSRDGRYYVGWFDAASGKVVYTWFDSFDQAIAFMQKNN